ncbi:MAG: enoyl-CoA hydratase/isomerase family protein [Acidobacteriaceae bacterium]
MLVDLEIAGGIGWLRLRRPESANALNGPLLRELYGLQRQLRRESQVRVVITLGEGKGFCSGSDLREQAGFSLLQAEKSQRLEARVCRELLRLRQPTIAGVHGYALGGGLFLATHHDFQIVAADARIGLPEVKLGWNPAFGIQRLCQLVGVGVATRWMMQGAEFLPIEAAERGCITHVVPASRDVLSACRKLAQEFLEMSPAGLSAIKQAIWNSYGRQTTRSDTQEALLFKKCLPTAQKRVAKYSMRKRQYK